MEDSHELGLKVPRHPSAGWVPEKEGEVRQGEGARVRKAQYVGGDVLVSLFSSFLTFPASSPFDSPLLQLGLVAIARGRLRTGIEVRPVVRQDIVRVESESKEVDLHD